METIYKKHSHNNLETSKKEKKRSYLKRNSEQDKHLNLVFFCAFFFALFLNARKFFKMTTKGRH